MVNRRNVSEINTVLCVQVVVTYYIDWVTTSWTDSSTVEHRVRFVNSRHVHIIKQFVQHYDSCSTTFLFDNMKTSMQFIVIAWCGVRSYHKFHTRGF